MCDIVYRVFHMQTEIKCKILNGDWLLYRTPGRMVIHLYAGGKPSFTATIDYNSC